MLSIFKRKKTIEQKRKNLIDKLDFAMKQNKEPLRRFKRVPEFKTVNGKFVYVR